jgi:hypothetical protein
VQEVDDFGGEPLQFVVEVVSEEIDALVGTFNARADGGEVLALFVAQLVEFGAKLMEKFFQLLFQRGSSLEVIDDLEENEEDGREGRRIDEPGGEASGIGFRRNFLGEERHQSEGKGVAKIKPDGWLLRR